MVKETSNLALNYFYAETVTKLLSELNISTSIS